MEKNNIINIVIGTIASFCIFTAIISSVESYQTRRLCNELRERVATAETTNRELADTVGQCKSISDDLGKSVERNISTARDCIEVIEEVRYEVSLLESVTGSIDWDSYYNNLDSYLQVE